MECTMPSAVFVPVDNEKTLEYISVCLDEAFRGSSFAKLDPDTRKRLQRKIADASKIVIDEM